MFHFNERIIPYAYDGIIKKISWSGLMNTEKLHVIFNIAYNVNNICTTKKKYKLNMIWCLKCIFGAGNKNVDSVVLQKNLFSSVCYTYFF